MGAPPWSSRYFSEKCLIICIFEYLILLLQQKKIIILRNDSPAIVLELKYDQDADTAINQIKQKNYPERVVPYTKNLLLVGINYDKQQKSLLVQN